MNPIVRSWKLLFLVFSAGTTMMVAAQGDGSSTEDENQCKLNCQNGGSCQVGSLDGEGHTFQYCLCPSGFLGELCEKDVGTPCGQNTCYHGSECVETADGDTIDGPSSFHCDCSASRIPGKHFAGRFCQFEATTYCSETSRDYFCLNGGDCVDQGDGVFTCDCDDEWAGPSCEFESENRDHGYENCTLPCNNGGQCRKGVKDMSLISGLGPELSQLIDESTHSENFEHCVCPDGFTGLQCQHEYAGCGNGEHICLHGSTCVPPTDPLNPVWSCDCAEPFREDQAYIGKFCQHHHTTVCTSSSMEDEPFQGSSNLVVCVNDGVCTQIVENGISYPACSCPDQYTGVYCELLRNTIPKDGSTLSTPKYSNAGIIVFTSILVVVIVIALFVIMLIRQEQLNEEKTKAIAMSHNEDEASRTPMIDRVDFDESALEDVDLL